MAFAKIAIQFGVHKLDYKCTVYTDGCGSMAHVKDAAIRLGIDHVYFPPYEQSMNEAEKVADRMWAAARVMMLQAKGTAEMLLQQCAAPEFYFHYAVGHAMYTHMRMASNPRRNWRSPFEAITGDKPDWKHMRPFYTRGYVHADKGSRMTLRRLIGYANRMHNTYFLLLDSSRVVTASRIEALYF